MTLRNLIYLLFIVSFIFTACNKDEEIRLPAIVLDSETGIYTVKIGKTLTIIPTVENVGSKALYSWILDGKLVGTDPVFSGAFTEEGEHYMIFRVEDEVGTVEEELRIDVLAMAPPLISFAAPESGLNLVANVEYVIAPDIQNAEGATFEWKLNGEVVGHEATYTFLKSELATYKLSLEATNEDGTGFKEINVNVLSRQPLIVEFDKPYYKAAEGIKNVFLGRKIFLRPYVENAIRPEYIWTLDGNVIEGADERTYVFAPETKGIYHFTVTVNDESGVTEKMITRNVRRSGKVSVTKEITVECHDEEAARMRKATSSSSIFLNKVYEYLPAPGQFVNETKTGGFTGNEKTMEDAIAYAEKRLKAVQYVSLGGFGGYIIVGFDHSIENKGNYQGYDFAISGNQFPGSSEPGIVWVMQDTNGNGEPDDEWYELRGSETGKSETIQEYSVTYYRPEAHTAVPWSDNQGKSGAVKYLGAFHNQASYYPIWMSESSYTLRGTCLKLRNDQNIHTGNWYNGEYDWGYADNFGKDHLEGENPNADPAGVHFAIKNAMNVDGSDANLRYIDFIKVQTGVNGQSGQLGEISTEVFTFTDKNLK